MSTQALRRGAAPSGRRAAKLRACVRLAKLDIFDYYLGVLVVWSLLAPAARLDGTSLATLGLFLAGEICVIAALVALDDRTGYLDGSDITNYSPNDPTRRIVRKPLVAGTLTVPEVTRFAWITALAGAALWTAAVLLAPHRPLWALVVTAVTFVGSLNYSWGLKLSYHGMHELFVAALGWALVLAPYGLLTGELTGFVLVQALLFGLGPLMFGVYSNTNDIAGDRSIGRPTVAVLTSPRGNAIFIGVLSAAEIALILGSAATGVAPWWFPVAMAPTIAARIWQYHIGFGWGIRPKGIISGDIMRARRLGIRIHRVTVALLVGVNLLMPLLEGGLS
ncbi:MAG TPA: UbiA family prenyltransferase [Pseudonocardiaceae bacterium]|nr:UbiA family prenyltransferase [Pseudonocardiaceae bacterium]